MGGGRTGRHRRHIRLSSLASASLNGREKGAGSVPTADLRTGTRPIAPAGVMRPAQHSSWLDAIDYKPDIDVVIMTSIGSLRDCE